MGADPETQDALETGGNILGGAAGSRLLPMATDLIPSTERAGQNFQRVMGAAKDRPLDLSKTVDPTMRAKELQQAGASLPTVINRFYQRTQDLGKPVTYEEGRDFASLAGRLSGQENSRMVPQMKAQVNALAGALADANEKAADEAGVGDSYRSAMKEYRQAMKIQGVTDKTGELAKQYAAKALLGAAAGAGGYEAYRKLSGR
jgi:hypothetical protein